MPITNREKLNFERFGCAFREGSRIILIDWKGRRLARASKASIFACLGFVRTKNGPIVVLAIEVSSTRPLPSYCYVPFDLGKKAHAAYLAQIAKTGQIGFQFVAEKVVCKRTHQLTPYLRSRASEIHDEAKREWEITEPQVRNFNSALQILETYWRVPEFVNRLLLEDTLNELSKIVEGAVETVPEENRELARSIVTDAAKAFLPYYQKNKKKFLETLFLMRRGLTYINDLHRMFVDNPERLARFVSDGLATTFPPEELTRLRELISLAESIPKLPFKEQPSTETETDPTLPVLPTGLTTLVQSMIGGISKEAALRFFDMIGLTTGGKPGRPTKDYSDEYDLRTSGSSWTEVTRFALTHRAELKAEFSGRDFDSLDYGEQDRLWNRIRQGVIGHAKRCGKPLPSEAETSEPPVTARVKKIDEK